jgi:hypothetical protein
MKMHIRHSEYAIPNEYEPDPRTSLLLRSSLSLYLRALFLPCEAQYRPRLVLGLPW